MTRKRTAAAPSRPRHLWSNCRGAAAVEFAFALPPLLLAMLGVVEFGRALWAENALHYSVEEAARCMTIDTSVCGSSSQIQNFAAARSGMSFPASTFSSTSAGCGNRVTGSYPFTFLTNLVNYSITLTASSCYPAG